MNEKKLREALDGMIKNRWCIAYNTDGDESKRARIQAVELEGVRMMITNPDCLDAIHELYTKEEA